MCWENYFINEVYIKIYQMQLNFPTEGAVIAANRTEGY